MRYERDVRRLALVILVAACSGEQAGSSVDGADLYARFCATCHGPTGKPDPTMAARLAVRDLTAPEFRAKVTYALVETQVRQGSQNKLMPAFAGAFTDEQIAALAKYVSDPSFVKKP
jgi:mono/diheme cytochrome c family protein